MSPERDNVSGMSPIEAITPGVYTADQPGALVDLLDFMAAAILLHIGVGGIAFSQANRIDFQILHGNAADGSDLTPVADTDILFDGLAPLPFTNGIVRSLVAAKPAADIQKVGYVGGKRYVKVIADFGGPHNTGTPIAVSVVRGRAALRGAA